MVSYLIGNELENIVQAALGVSEFWASMLVFAVGQTIDWSQLCATDPPAMPTFTAQDIAGILATPWTDAGVPWQKLSDLMLNAFWVYGCQCDSGAVVTPPAYPAIPPGAPMPNTPNAPPSVSGACSDVSSSFTLVGNNPDPLNTTMLSAQFLPGDAVSGLTGSTARVTTGLTVPPECQSIAFDSTWSYVGTPNSGGVAVVFEWFGANKVTMGQLLVSDNTAFHQTHTFTKPSGAIYYTLWAGTNNAANSAYSLRATMTCTAGPGSILQPCCPPDPTLLGQLQQILLTAQANYKLTTTIQRYGLPFAYITGATHAALQGSGTLPINRLVGVRAVVTAYPPTNQTFTGQPPYLTDLGWLSVENGDGMIDEIRLTRANQVWMSRLFPSAITFGYALRAGVTVTISELEPEP